MRTYTKECRHGKFLLIHGDMISEFVNLYGEWCEGEVELFQQIIPPDGVVIEVGSNIGMHAVPIARICSQGTLISFEPQRNIFQILCANLAMNSLTNAHAVRAAVGDACGLIDIQSSRYDAAWNYGAFSVDKGFSTENPFGEEVHTEKVNVFTLDHYLEEYDFRRVDFIKIDAEGYEKNVLRGAGKTIKEHRPILFIENNKETGSADLLGAVRNLGYKPYWFVSTRCRENNFNQATWHIDGIDSNIICIPDGSAVRPDLSEAVSFSEVENGQVRIY
ncbi:FkbM family methyltransferase [Paraburkholderia sp. Tr-20389]|uniref:FkbM family methyltransferase n=1 Tax=Paraburkholderia sp. Tr-20389 TaxID=2703903 RepID=UPI00197D201A|nr:FkbM family methyltransferase [Paraburkholderia sp. Tr-20389]MBN3751647.1 FkbM family methyltransferase [Paraburkholderia sp. Tr-20389]